MTRLFRACQVAHPILPFGAFAQSPLQPRDLLRAELLGMAPEQLEDRRMRLAGAALQFLCRGSLDRQPL
ncbi:hypothetical protein [Xanthomonas bundabergensis]|uniref:hypothetical protein n=1 Tax=Xanthomonas bundabergensis TaxID=3160842 RepID=UPI0035178A36